MTAREVVQAVEARRQRRKDLMSDVATAAYLARSDDLRQALDQLNHEPLSEESMPDPDDLVEKLDNLFG
jgi:hypothetical protein